MIGQDCGDAAHYERQHNHERIDLTTPCQFDSRAVLKTLLLDSVIRLALGQREDAISESRMDGLVLAQILRCRIRRLSKTNALLNNFAGNAIRNEALGLLLTGPLIITPPVSPTFGWFGVPRWPLQIGQVS